MDADAMAIFPIVCSRIDFFSEQKSKKQKIAIKI